MAFLTAVSGAISLRNNSLVQKWCYAILTHFDVFRTRNNRVCINESMVCINAEETRENDWIAWLECRDRKPRDISILGLRLVQQFVVVLYYVRIGSCGSSRHSMWSRMNAYKSTPSRDIPLSGSIIHIQKSYRSEAASSSKVLFAATEVGMKMNRASTPWETTKGFRFGPMTNRLIRNCFEDV